MLGCAFVLGSSISWTITFRFLIVQGGVCGKMLLWILVRKVVDSWKIGSIWRPNGLIDFFFFKILSVIGIKCTVVSWIGWTRFQFGVILKG